MVETESSIFTEFTVKEDDSECCEMMQGTCSNEALWRIINGCGCVFTSCDKHKELFAGLTDQIIRDKVLFNNYGLEIPEYLCLFCGKDKIPTLEDVRYERIPRA